MKLIHLTDTHLVVEPQTLYGLDPRARLRDALASIAHEHADADAIVITGDLCHWGEEDAYLELAAILDTCKTPPLLMLGNHDERASFRRVFSQAPDDGNGFVQDSLLVAGHRLLLLDTKAEGTHAGSYDSVRLEWLAARLSEGSEPVLMFMHHPPFPVGISSMDALKQQDAEAIETLLVRHAARIRHIFMGHVHRPIFGNWRGISFSILPSLMHQVALDLHPHGNTIPGSHEPPAYSVVLVEDDRVMVHLFQFADASIRFGLDGDEALGRAYALGFDAAVGRRTA